MRHHMPGPAFRAYGIIFWVVYFYVSLLCSKFFYMFVVQNPGMVTFGIFLNILFTVKASLPGHIISQFFCSLQGIAPNYWDWEKKEKRMSLKQTNAQVIKCCDVEILSKRKLVMIMGFDWNIKKKCLHLQMSQELGIVEKDKNYVNPYKEETIKVIHSCSLSKSK